MLAFRGTSPHTMRWGRWQPGRGPCGPPGPDREGEQVHHFRKGLLPVRIAVSTSLALELTERACLAVRVLHPNRGHGPLNVTLAVRGGYGSAGGWPGLRE